MYLENENSKKDKAARDRGRSLNSVFYDWNISIKFPGFVRQHLYYYKNHFKYFKRTSFLFFFLSLSFFFCFLQVSVRAGSHIGFCSRGQTWVNKRKGHFTDGTSLRRQILVNTSSLNNSYHLMYEKSVLSLVWIITGHSLGGILMRYFLWFIS